MMHDLINSSSSLRIAVSNIVCGGMLAIDKNELMRERECIDVRRPRTSISGGTS